MKRYYYIRDRRIEVEQIDDALAVQVETDEKGSPRGKTRDYGKSATDAIRGHADLDLPKDVMDAFKRANWLFVKPSSKTERARSDNEAMPNTTQIGKMVYRKDGSMGIATRRMSVQLQSDLSEAECEATLAEHGLQILTKLRFAPNLYEVNAINHDDSLDASVALHDDDRFTLAEPALTEFIGQRLTPTDPDYADQWQWNNTGAGGGTAGADVSAEAAWDLALGDDIRVAVIDNGFDADHEDLVAGVSGMSGYFTAGSPATFTQGTAGMPGSNHGTFCAGLVGARQNNGLGVTGGAPNCDLTLIASLGDQVGDQITLARAVAYAADPSTEVAGADPNDGADILVSSLGPNGAVWNLTATLDMALDNAAANGRGGRGLAIFWAASNGNNVDVTQDEVVSHDDVIAVVRSDRNDMEDNAAQGDTVELIAPGVDVTSTQSNDGYGTGTGTSYAAPCAASCAALALSTNPDLTRDELRQIMRDTADQIGGVVYDATGHNDDYGFGRVNAEQAVRAAALRVQLLTSSVVFNDVPEGETTARSISWQAFGFEDLTFEITSGPTGPFSPLLGNSVTISSPGIGTGETARIWLTYTGTTAGATATGSVDVRCVETGETWTVPISANTIARPKVAVSLVLDQSGSMDFDAGDGRKRVDVLKEAAQTFVDVIQPTNALGIVRFDHDAFVGMNIQDAGPEVFGPGRAAATAAVAAHVANPAGATSIGDGIELAGSELDATTGFDSTAMIVLTDGQENSPKFIADVASQIDDNVFAIGLGAPEVINPAALDDITNSTGGYVVMTGNLSQDEYFLLSKYYLQILAGVTNEEVVLDPQGHVKPRIPVEIPFTLNETDAGADVILLSPAPSVIDFYLRTPNGDIIKPTSPPTGVTFASGKTTSYYRFNLPLVNSNGVASGSGKWTAILDVDSRKFGQYLESIDDDKEQEYVRTHGVRYAVEVHARSSLKFKGRVQQKSIEPGSTLRLSANLSEFGIPMGRRRARVTAEITGPFSQVPKIVKLKQVDDGLFQGTFKTTENGTYKVRLVANGKTLRGTPFTRETTLSGSVYRPRPPEEPPKPVDPQDRPPKGCQQQFQALWAVLKSDRQLVQYLTESLQEIGADPKAVFSCIKKAAGQTTITTIGNIGGLTNIGGGLTGIGVRPPIGTGGALVPPTFTPPAGPSVLSGNDVMDELGLGDANSDLSDKDIATVLRLAARYLDK